MDKLTKAFKGDANLEDNRLRVVASTTGNIDRSGDVILPGAFKSAVLRDFETHGWIDIGHAWDGLPVAMPVSAKMSGDQLISEAEFHGTERGQEARQVVKERMDAGKSVSVSIGFMPDYSSARTFDSGAELLRWAEKDGLDVSAFDSPAIKGWKGATRAIAKVAELYEWSIVTVGMNPKAKAIAVKTFSLDDADSGCPLSEHLQLALGAAEDIATRLESLGEARAEKGAYIAAAHRESVESLIERLVALRGYFRADEPATAGIDEALRLRALQIRSAFITN
jgi:hypothetical protein